MQGGVGFGRRLPNGQPAGFTAGRSNPGLRSIFKLLSSFRLLAAGALGNTAPPEAPARAASESSTAASGEALARESGLALFFDPVMRSLLWLIVTTNAPAQPAHEVCRTPPQLRSSCPHDRPQARKCGKFHIGGAKRTDYPGVSLVSALF